VVGNRVMEEMMDIWSSHWECCQLVAIGVALYYRRLSRLVTPIIKKMSSQAEGSLG